MSRKVILSLLAGTSCAAGLVLAPVTVSVAATPHAAPARVAARVAPAAPAAPARVATPSGPRPRLAGCDSAVVFAATMPCDFPGAGTAVYTLTVGGPDRLRVRAAEPTFSGTPSVVVRGAAPICTHTGSDQFDCAVPAAGTYTVEVSIAVAGTVYTTVDSVRHPGDCAPDADLGATAPGLPISITDPGASYCTLLGTRAGDVLRFVFQPTADDPLQITVYNALGAPVCAVEPLFSAAECTLGGGSGFRMFVNWGFDAARSTVLFATRLSRPSGCQRSAADDFGVAPTRSAPVVAHRVRCFTVAVMAGHPLAVQVAPTAIPSRLLTWSVRTPNGSVACTGDTSSGAIACPAPVSGRYALFVAGPTGSSGAPTTRVRVLLASLLDSAGCAALASTAFGADPDLGTLATPGEVDCRAFTAHGGHAVEITPYDLSRHLGIMLVDPNGAQVCRASIRTTCVLPHLTGTYRLLLFGFGTTKPVDYRVWVTDLDSTAGCTPTSADDLGSAPTRTGPINDTVVNQCWTFAATEDDAYLLGLTTASGAVFARLRVREIGRFLTCDTTTSSHTGCVIPETGTYVMYAEQYLDGPDPSQDGVVRVGLWRLAPQPACVTARLSFTAPPIEGSFDAPDEVDCAVVTTTDRELLTISAGGSPDLSVQHQVYQLNGRRKCTVYPGGDCRLRNPGTYLVVTYSVQHQVEPYTMTIRSVTEHRGCASAGPSAFGTAPEHFAVEPGIPACFAFHRASTAGSVLLRVQSESSEPVRYSLHDGYKRRVCGGVAGLRPCHVVGTGPFVLVLYGSGPSTGTAAIYSPVESPGCAPTPSLRFDVRPAQGVLRHAGQVDCIDLGAADAARTLRLAIAHAPDGAVLHLGVYDLSGHLRCQTDTTNYFRWLTCAFRKNVATRALIWLGDGQGVTTGRYAIHVWTFTHPAGCTKLGRATNGFGAVVGRFADPNDEDCYQFSVPAGTSLHLVVDDPDDTSTPPPWVDVRRPDGGLACEIDRVGNCTLAEATTYSMIVFARSGLPDYVDSYRIVATRN